MESKWKNGCKWEKDPYGISGPERFCVQDPERLRLSASWGLIDGSLKPTGGGLRGQLIRPHYSSMWQRADVEKGHTAKWTSVSV